MRKTVKQTISIRLEALLTHKYLPLIAAALGVISGLPTLWVGWGYSDDVLQRSFLLSANFQQALTRLYLFLDPAVNSRLMDSGIFPWWTLENARVFFFRPLSALSLWLDYQLWPNSPALMHLHSILWYGALCVIAALLYRRLAGNTTSTGLAMILFSLSTAHIGCVISLAARNLLMAAFFGFLTIYFHDRWRKEGWRAGLLLSLLCTLLGLLSAESGIAAFAFLLAYAIFLDKDTRPRRLASLVPYLLVILSWWTWYQINGYGTWGSGFYLNPVREPLQFAIAVVERAPMLLLGQWITPDPVTYAVFSTGAKFLYWIIGLIILILIGWLFFPLIRRDRTARFWTFGMLMAVIPVCAVSPPSGRHLLFISFGVFGLMGHFIIGKFYRQDWLPTRKIWRTSALVMCVIFLGLHGFLYPLLGPVVRNHLDTYSIAISELGSYPDVESKDMIIVNAPSPSLFIYLPAIRDLKGQPMPAHLRVLAPGYTSISLTRLDETTLLVRPESGFLLSSNSLIGWVDLLQPLYSPSYGFRYGDQLFRGDAYPMSSGQQVELTGLQIEVISLTGDGRPLETRMQFTRPLEDELFIWLVWDWNSYQYAPFSLPAVGETVQIPGPF